MAPVCLAVLMAVGAARGQVIELGVQPPAAETVQPPELGPEEARALAVLPDGRASAFRRFFDGQMIRIEVFRFARPETGYSWFTFLQRSGAKPYSELSGCFVQDQEMVVWRSRVVVRTVFEQLTRAHLSGYFDWLTGQFPEQEPVPDLYRQLPAEGMIRPSRRFLVRDAQLPLLWADGPSPDFGLDRGARLAAARYRGPRGPYWAGWLAPAVPEDAAALLARDGSAAGPSGGILRLERAGARLAVYRGPGDPETVRTAFARLREAARNPEAAGEIDLSRFYRRDEYTYADLIWTGIRFVGLLLVAALAAGLLAGGGIVAFRRLSRRPDGLAAETMVRLRLDGVPAAPARTAGSDAPGADPPTTGH
jgi:hypothetical protein